MLMLVTLTEARHYNEMLRAPAIAQGLDFRVCAEGIESEFAFNHLRALGCQEGQGHFMAHPSPADRRTDWLEAHP